MNSSTLRLLTLTALVAAASPALADDRQEQPAPASVAASNSAPEHPGVRERFNEAHVSIGAFAPNARSDFWDDNSRKYTVSADELVSLGFGVDYMRHFDRHNAIEVGLGLAFGTVSESSRYLKDESGAALEHHLETATVSLSVGYDLFPFGTDHRVIPYVGAGVGLYVGSVTTYKDITPSDDCGYDDDDNYTCVPGTQNDRTSSSFLTLGYFVQAGLEVPVTPHLAVLANGRYTVAHAILNTDFGENRQLDLSGAQGSVGVAVRF